VTEAFSTLLRWPGLRASNGGVLATKRERKMLASTCLYSLCAWLIQCSTSLPGSILKVCSCCLRRVSSDSIVTLKRRSLWLGVGCVGWHRRTGKRLIAVTLTSVRMSMTSNPSITRTARATPVGAARPCDFVLNIVADWTVAVDNDAVAGRPAVD